MDWKNIIAELKAYDLTEVQIAEACGCAQSTINALGNGKALSTKYAIGAALQALLAKTRRRKKPVANQEA